MSSPRLAAVLPLVWVLLTGCNPPPAQPASPTTSALQLAVQLPAEAPSGEISRVTVTVSGSAMAARFIELTRGQGGWSGVLTQLPAGSHYTFLAQAFTDSRTLRHEARAEELPLAAGARGLLILALHDVSTPAPPSGQVLVIDTLRISHTTVAPGGKVSMTASAHAPPSGGSVSLGWSASSGSLSAADQAEATWTAPNTPGPAMLTLTVRDSRGAALARNVPITVSAEPEGDPGAEVPVDFNAAPQAVTVGASVSTLDVGQRTVLSASARDGDGDTLHYQWSATCVGTFTGEDTAHATFTPRELPTEACGNCELRVVVEDGRGGSNTGRLPLCVSRDAPRLPPAIVRAYQSSQTPKAGEGLIFEVEATDPADSALAFSWESNVDTPGRAWASATRGQLFWTSLPCVRAATAPRFTATVSNVYGLTATRSFTVTGLPECAPRWLSTGPLASPRLGHAALRLSTGQVLLLGGYGHAVLETAELYDPGSGTSRRTDSMALRRFAPGVTPLADGRVLVSGGSSSTTSLDSVEIYNPASGSWSFTGTMSGGRYAHTATLLPSGKVLVAGGHNSIEYFMRTAEVYDPSLGTWKPTGTMDSPRQWHTATLLPGGKVLVAGGYSGTSSLDAAQVYDPAAGTWSSTGAMSTPRHSHTATLLSDGRVLVSGGARDAESATATAEVYDPGSNTWSATGAMSTPRQWHTATRLLDGRVLVTGGDTRVSGPLETAEVYDPGLGTWSPTAPMAAKRRQHTATLLSTGQVLISGGEGAPATAELYDPAP